MTCDLVTVNFGVLKMCELNDEMTFPFKSHTYNCELFLVTIKNDFNFPFSNIGKNDLMMLRRGGIIMTYFDINEKLNGSSKYSVLCL